MWSLRTAGLTLAAGLLGGGLTFVIAVAAPKMGAGPVPGLPEGTQFGLDGSERPRQILKAEAAGGKQSWLVALGNTAFSAPSLFGPKAREAGLSCDTCHRQGDVNPRFFIPGVSARHGGLDPTTSMFNPTQDDDVANHVDIPSLRGARFNAPYGRDGRIPSLRDFARNVIVQEFGGPEPAPIILDALVAYMEQIEFLPNPQIDRLGQLTAAASPAAKRGETLFKQPIAGMGGRSCATCHVPDAQFADGRRHDVGSDGLYKTPTLLNARFTAPYFHDGRYAGFADVVAHFDRVFTLGLTAAQRADLAAYLEAVGDADQPFEPMTRQSEMSELASYVAVIDDAIGRADQPAIDLVVDTVVRDLRFIARRFDNRDPRTGRIRRPDRPDVARIAEDLAAHMISIGARARAGDADGARESLRLYRERATALVASYPQTN
jgi:cytochrome c peroxidase